LKRSAELELKKELKKIGSMRIPASSTLREGPTWQCWIFQAVYPTFATQKDVLGSNLGLQRFVYAVLRYKR
jgi:hypothetical protein